MVREIPEKLTRMIKLEKENLNKTITLVSCCNECYNYKTLYFDDIKEECVKQGLNKEISYFDIEWDINGFEDRLKILDVDDNKCLLEIIRYHYESDDYEEEEFIYS